MDRNKKIAIVLIVLILIGTSVVFWIKGRNVYPEKNRQPENSQNIAADGNVSKRSSGALSEVLKLSCENGWQEYRQDTIGIAFCYPEGWGEPTNDSIKKITRLSDMEADFERLNTYYENKLDINFENNKQANVRLFNDKYSGKRKEQGINDPSIYYESGATDDVARLKINSNICDYQIGYDYKFTPEAHLNTLKTIYIDCTDGIKTVLAQDKEIFERTLFTYDLRLLSFKKINNGYFDNVLISYAINQADQIQEEIKTLDEFFNSKKTTQVENGVPTKTAEQFNQERKEFRKFIESMVTFRPVLKIAAEFRQVPEEDPNITTIRRYYWLIEAGKLDAAYAMYADKAGTSMEKFRERYRDVYSAEAFDVKSKGENRYEFHVRYQDHNSEETKFRVIMEVSGNIVRTIFLEEYASEVVKFGNMETYAARRGNKNYVFLKQNGKETIVDEGEAEYNKEYSNISEVKFFGTPEFSQSGNYLIYTMSGWEWSVTYIYDIENSKRVAEMPSPEKYGLITDEKYTYYCSSPGMLSGGGRVISLPSGKVEYDIFDDKNNSNYMSIACDYAEGSDYVAFTLDEYGEGHKVVNSKKEIRFNLKDKKVTEIK